MLHVLMIILLEWSVKVVSRNKMKRVVLYSAGSSMAG